MQPTEDNERTNTQHFRGKKSFASSQSNQQSQTARGKAAEDTTLSQSTHSISWQRQPHPWRPPPSSCRVSPPNPLAALPCLTSLLASRPPHLPSLLKPFQVLWFLKTFVVFCVFVLFLCSWFLWGFLQFCAVEAMCVLFSLQLLAADKFFDLFVN